MSWKAVKELNEKRAAAFSAAQKIRETARGEDRDLNGDEKAAQRVTMPHAFDAILSMFAKPEA